ncbi:MAG: hypothetical protein ACLQPD_13800 [Desulfomonilaceae bacterium]
MSASYVDAGWFSSDKPKASQEQTKPVPKEQSKPAVQTAPSKPKSEPKEKPTASSKAVSEIPWSEVHKKFIRKDHDLTSAQKDKLEKDRKQWWNDYKGKWVRWKGSVQNVPSGGAAVYIDMGEGSWVMQDIILRVAPESREKALGLNKDSYITFVGRMDEQPGTTLPMELHEVIIEQKMFHRRGGFA